MQLLRLCLILLAVGPVTAAVAQRIPCSEVLESEREFVRRLGGCRDVAPIVNVAPRRPEPASPVVMLVPNVIGLSFDDARARLVGFEVRRSYRASAEAGGTVLEQQPSPPARMAAGGTVRIVLSDATLRPAPRVSAAEVDGIPSLPAVATSRGQPAAGDIARTAPPDTASPPSPPRSTADPLPAARAEQPAPAKIGQSQVSKAEQRPAVVERPTKSRAEPVVPGVERLPVPNVIGMTAANAEARLARFNVERRSRSSRAPEGRVIQQIPRASARAAPGSEVVLIVSGGPATAKAAPVTVSETLELPNVVERSFAEASSALAEFKVERVDIAAAAPASQVLAQDPVPGAQVRPGSTITLRVSDGSLAAAATAPAVAPIAVPAAPVPAAPAQVAPAQVAPAQVAPAQVAPVEQASAPASPPASASGSKAAAVNRAPVTIPRGPTIALIAAVLLGLGLGAMLMRRWFFNRQASGPAFTAEPADTLPVQAETAVAAVEVAPPSIVFTARLDAGETSIEFAAPPDADETTLEHSRELHE